jgi:hypothetical protein
MNHVSRSLKKLVNRAKGSIVLVRKEAHEGPVAWYLSFTQRWVVVEQESPEAVRVDKVEGEVVIR